MHDCQPSSLPPNLALARTMVALHRVPINPPRTLNRTAVEAGAPPRRRSASIVLARDHLNFEGRWLSRCSQPTRGDLTVTAHRGNGDIDYVYALNCKRATPVL
jgi:hypothetical protein